MSSTVRVFVNDKRVATGKPWNNKFLQVYPAEKVFVSEGEWRSFVYQSVINGIRFESGEDSEIESSTSAPVPTTPPSVPVSVANPVTNTPASLQPSDWVHKHVRKAKLPAGKYYIGDLCYALQDKLYDKVFGSEFDSGLYTSKKNPNHVFWLDNTGGDGCFKGSDGNEYCVDAGIIGIAAYDTLDPEKAPFEGGHIYTFTTPVCAKFKEDKFLFYGETYDEPRISIRLYSEDDEDYYDSE